jgi:hypothetical protein
MLPLLCITGVMTVLRRPATWDESKKQLGDPAFMSKLLVRTLSFHVCHSMRTIKCMCPQQSVHFLEQCRASSNSEL